MIIINDDIYTNLIWISFELLNFFEKNADYI